MSIKRLSNEAHFFIPQAEQKIFTVKPQRIPATAPEFRSSATPEIISSYTFPETHYPKRICDIFILNPETMFYYSNRPIVTNVSGTIVRGFSTFTYDVKTRTLYVNSPLTSAAGNLRIDWIDIAKFPKNYWWGGWQPLNVFGYQENKIIIPKKNRSAYTHVDIDYTENKYIYDVGSYRFQGHEDNTFTPDINSLYGSKCYIEICSQPVFGYVALNDTMDGLMYRTSLSRNPVGRDTFQYKLYNQWHQESDAHCIQINLK